MESISVLRHDLDEVWGDMAHLDAMGITPLSDYPMAHYQHLQLVDRGVEIENRIAVEGFVLGIMDWAKEWVA